MLGRIAAASMPRVAVRSGAMRYNLTRFSHQFPHRNPRLIVLVKGDAYGHGLKVAAREATRMGHRVGVATLAEAAELKEIGIRNAFITSPFLPTPAEADACLSLGATPFVGSYAVLQQLNDCAGRMGIRAPVHLEFDTGMGRFGFLDTPKNPVDVDGIVDMLHRLPHIHVDGVMTHYAYATDVQDDNSAHLQQYEAFCDILQRLSCYNIRPAWVHCSNTGAATNFPQTCFPTARVGQAVYGMYAGPVPAPSKRVYESLEPAMTWTGSVIEVRHLGYNMPISYYGKYRTTRPSRIAAINVGFANGYPWQASNKGAVVVINGRRYPVVGNIMMNTMMVDVTDAKSEIKPGSKVMLFGRCEDTGALLSMNELSTWADTVPSAITLMVNKSTNRWLVDDQYRVPGFMDPADALDNDAAV